MNTAAIVGHIAAKPELRLTASGQKVTNLRVAVNRVGANADGADWFDVVVFGENASNCALFLAKGSRVGIEGRLSTRSWTGRDEVKRWSVEIIANRVEFLSPRLTAEAPPVEEKPTYEQLLAELEIARAAAAAVAA